MNKGNYKQITIHKSVAHHHFNKTIHILHKCNAQCLECQQNGVVLQHIVLLSAFKTLPESCSMFVNVVYFMYNFCILFNCVLRSNWGLRQLHSVGRAILPESVGNHILLSHWSSKMNRPEWCQNTCIWIDTQRADSRRILMVCPWSLEI